MAVAAGLLGPLALAAILVPFRAHFPNTDAALAMLLVVVAVAANGNRLAGYLAAVSTAVWFDFFLTRPYEQFTINRQTDIETTVLLLVIGVAVTELAVWGRRQQTAASRRPATWTGSAPPRGGRRRGRRRRSSSSRCPASSPGCCRCGPAAGSTAWPGSATRPGCGTTAGSRSGEQVWDAESAGLPAGHRDRAAGGERRPAAGPVPAHARCRAAGRPGSSCWWPSRWPTRWAPRWAAATRPGADGPARAAAQSPAAARIACQTRCGEAGMSMCRTPRWLSASTMAFCTAGVAPIVPASPMPLAPSGL